VWPIETMCWMGPDPTGMAFFRRMCWSVVQNSEYAALQSGCNVPVVECLYFSAVGAVHLAHAADQSVCQVLRGVVMQPLPKRLCTILSCFILVFVALNGQ